VRTFAGHAGLVLAALLLATGSAAASGAGLRESLDAGLAFGSGITGCAGGVGPVDTALAWARCQGMITLSLVTGVAGSVCVNHWCPL
jgi:hypothetical protein